MKNKLLLLIVIALSVSSFAQEKEVSVEKSIFGVQAGLFGIWGYNEVKLSNTISLRTELGINMGIWGGTSYPKTGYILFPTVSVEPRYYYNLNRRAKLNKKTANNNGNFFSLKTNFNPNLFTISNYNNSYVHNHITVIPKWGLRRSFAKNFEYEFSAGIGYVYDFEMNKGGTGLDLGFRVGYRF
ncbi:hypothetical protein [Tenacibaculum sp. nBUS_03]|uniref:hypothetical protein n=1 Tax=Tenacibaculum sp. nBUS_03 TaxID=3395320 RepID=UPI003EBFD98F